MVKKSKHHMDSSSSDDDINHHHTRNLSAINGADITTSPNVSSSHLQQQNRPVAIPFTLQVPATYANKHPALVDRNGLVSSSLSEKQNPTNSHKVPQQKEETWRRPDLMQTRFQGPSATM